MRAPYDDNNAFLTRKYRMKYVDGRDVLYFYFIGNINPTPLCIESRTLFKRNCPEFYSKTPLPVFFFIFHFTRHIIGLLWTLDNINRKLNLRTNGYENNNNRKLNYCAAAIWIPGPARTLHALPRPAQKPNRARPSRNTLPPPSYKTFVSTVRD